MSIIHMIIDTRVANMGNIKVKKKAEIVLLRCLLCYYKFCFFASKKRKLEGTGTYTDNILKIIEAGG